MDAPGEQCVCDVSRSSGGAKVFMCCECDAPGELLLCLGAMSALYEVCQGGIRCVCVVYAGLPKLI